MNIHFESHPVRIWEALRYAIGDVILFYPLFVTCYWYSLDTTINDAMYNVVMYPVGVFLALAYFWKSCSKDGTMSIYADMKPSARGLRNFGAIGVIVGMFTSMHVVVLGFGIACFGFMLGLNVFPNRKAEWLELDEITQWTDDQLKLAVAEIENAPPAYFKDNERLLVFKEQNRRNAIPST